MYEVIENCTIYSKPVLAKFDTFFEAEAYVMTNYKVIVFEIDEDHDGCADFFTQNGIVGQIEHRSI